MLVQWTHTVQACTLRDRVENDGQDPKCTLSDVVLRAIERELARREWRERLAKRAVTDLGTSAASLLEQERQERRQDLA